MRSADKLWAIFIVAVMAVCSVGQSYATVINATDARGIRSLEGGEPFLLDFLSILLPGPPIEDRTVLEFDVERSCSRASDDTTPFAYSKPRSARRAARFD